MLSPEVQFFVEKAIEGGSEINESRFTLLSKMASDISEQLKKGEPVKLVFICTHNSRRSHMAQLWAAIMAVYFEVKSIETYSGGTEVTSFNAAAVDAMRRTGLDIQQENGENPVYTVSYSSAHTPIRSFSKVYNHGSNPSKDFIAVMTCSDADDNCPIVTGAGQRISLYYEDPKISDGTPLQEQTYDARCRQIAVEMACVFGQVSRREENDAF